MSLLDSGENTVAYLFPKYVSKQLEKNHPGISLDDIGVKIRDRKTNCSRWEDFPQPWSVTEENGQMTVRENLNFNPNNFDTVTVKVFSDRNQNKQWDAGEPLMNTVEIPSLYLHNRRFVVHFKQTGANAHQMFLTMAPFRPGTSGIGVFNGADEFLPKQEASIPLIATENSIVFTIDYKRHKTLPGTFTPPAHWETPMGFQNILRHSETRTIKKGDLNALCLTFGRVTEKMVRLHIEEYQAAQQERLQDQTPNEILDHASTYIMGMSYYEKVSRFRQQLEKLTKTQTISNLANGFAKLGARRNPDGTLINNGEIDLVSPQVDMGFQLAAFAGNMTLRPDQGAPVDIPITDFLALAMADISCQEHAIIDEFHQQKEAASTATLLHKSKEIHSEIITLTKDNYITEGNKLIPFKGVTKKLMDWCEPELWNIITADFSKIWSDHYIVYLTKGPQILAQGSYTGMGAFYIKPEGAGALISSTSLLNGGYGKPVGNYTFRPQNYKNLIIKQNSSGSPYITTTAPTAQNAVLMQSIAATNSIHQLNLNIASGAVKLSNADTKDLQKIQSRIDYQPKGNQPTSIPARPPATPASGVPVVQVTPTPAQMPSQPDAPPVPQLPPSVPRVPPTIPQLITTAQNFGSLLTPAWYGDKLQKFVSDPVNVISGEFYIDTLDLDLRGPMPLAIRRNYSSQNLGFSEFGRGWKISLVSYITIASGGNVLYAAEMDGSIIAYVKDPNNPNKWNPTVADNPSLTNISGNQIGSIHNPFNAYILKEQKNKDTIYILQSPDGAKRTYKVRQYPIGEITRERPYLEKWEDNKGNFYTFKIGNNPTKRNDYGQLTRIESSNGNFLAFTYNFQSQIIETFTGDGRRTYYRYDEYGDLVRVTHADGSKTRYTYKHEKQTVGGKEQTYSTHLLISERKPGDRLLENDYDSEGRVTAQRATVGENLIPVQNASFTYTNTKEEDGTISGRTIVEDAFKNKTHYEYSKGLITKIKDPAPLNQEITQEWYASGATSTGAYPRSLKERTDKRGLTTQYKYDTKGNLIERITIGDITGDRVSDTATTKYTYNANNLPTSILDPIGNETIIIYENATYPWLPTRIEGKSQGTTVSNTMNTYYEINTGVRGLLQKMQTAAGTPDESAVEYTHDARGFLTSEKKNVGSGANITTRFFYNQRGELIEQTDPAGAFTRFAYDPLGNQTWLEQHDERGALLSWKYTYYNYNGEVEWIDGPRYNPEDYIWRKYDGAGRIKEELRWRSQANKNGDGVEAPRGNDFYATTFYKHDLFGNLVEIKDPRRNSTLMKYDAIGQMLSRTYYEGYAPTGKVVAVETFAHEPGGEISIYTDPLGAITKKYYTADGKPYKQENPDGSVQEWRYRLDGRLEKEILPNGTAWETSYNDATRTVTRKLKSPSGENLASEVAVLNGQGELLSYTDAKGHTFTKTYNKIGQTKKETGPAASTNAAEQTTTITHDPNGRSILIANSLGESRQITRDVLGRITGMIDKDSSHQTIRSTTYTYSADKNSVTQIEGTEQNATKTTLFTDTFGAPVLKLDAKGGKQRLSYDHGGNLTAFSDELGQTTTNTFDALTRLLSTTLPGGAQTAYKHDAAGNLLEYAMPGGLNWSATYDSASRQLSEKLTGNNGQETRKRTYSYHSSGADKGRLEKISDGRDLTHAFTYNPFGDIQKIETTGSVTGTQELTWDKLGLLTSIAQTSSQQVSVNITRNYSPYGDLTEETIKINGEIHQQATQKWDGAGRRTQLSLGNFEQNFGYRADGLLSEITLPRQNKTVSYTYLDNGLLSVKNSGGLEQHFTQDPLGRIERQWMQIGSERFLTEDLTWNANSTLSRYESEYRGDSKQTRAFTYNARGQLLTEGTALGSTLSFEFDGNTLGNGLGVRTKASQQNPPYEQKIIQHDPWSRIAKETTNQGSLTYELVGTSHFANVRLQINKIPLGSVASNADCSWKMPVSLQPGSYLLEASGEGASLENCPPNQKVERNFTVGPQARTHERTYDGEGNLTKTITAGPNNQTKTRELTWNAWNRLTKITERDNQNSGYNWSAIYDPFGRRLKTTHTPVTAGALVTAKTQTISSYFDPQIEFLEVGVKVNDAPTTWKAYGIDKDGTYGGLQGIGGLEMLFTPNKTYSIIHDALGHVVATHDGTETKKVPTQVGAYGPLPGSLALPLSSFRGLEQVTHWQGKRLDETGLIWIGDRYYDPANGTWISADPLGHFSSWALHGFCNGNPIGYVDPTGRIATGFHQGAIKGDYFDPSNTAQGVGKFVGQVGVGFIPWVGQAADIRDLTAAWNVGRTHGWNFGTSASLAMAGVAFMPGVGDVARSIVKPLLGSPAGQAGVKALHSGPTSAVAKAPITDPSRLLPAPRAAFNPDLPGGNMTSFEVGKSGLLLPAGRAHGSNPAGSFVSLNPIPNQAYVRGPLATLPAWNPATHVSDVFVPPGVRLQMSSANPHPALPGSGYGPQLQILNEADKARIIYSNTRPLQ